MQIIIKHFVFNNKNLMFNNQVHKKKNLPINKVNSIKNKKYKNLLLLFKEKSLKFLINNHINKILKSHNI